MRSERNRIIRLWATAFALIAVAGALLGGLSSAGFWLVTVASLLLLVAGAALDRAMDAGWWVLARDRNPPPTPTARLIFHVTDGPERDDHRPDPYRNPPASGYGP